MSSRFSEHTNKDIEDQWGRLAQEAIGGGLRGNNQVIASFGTASYAKPVSSASYAKPVSSASYAKPVSSATVVTPSPLVLLISGHRACFYAEPRLLMIIYLQLTSKIYYSTYIMCQICLRDLIQCDFRSSCMAIFTIHFLYLLPKVPVLFRRVLTNLLFCHEHLCVWLCSVNDTTEIFCTGERLREIKTTFENT